MTTRAKQRKQLGKQFKVEYKLPHVVAMRLGRLATKLGGYTTSLRLDQAEADRVLSEVGLKTDFDYEMCCANRDHGYVAVRMRLVPVAAPRAERS